MREAALYVQSPGVPIPGGIELMTEIELAKMAIFDLEFVERSFDYDRSRALCIRRRGQAYGVSPAFAMHYIDNMDQAKSALLERWISASKK